MRDNEPPLPPPMPAHALTVPSRLRRTLHTLRSSFRPGLPFHIGSLKRSGSAKSSASDGEIARDERTMRKRNKKQRDPPGGETSRSTDTSPSVDKKKKDGNFMKRMGSIGKKRAEDTTSPPETETAVSPMETDPFPQPDTPETILESEPTPPSEPESVDPEPESVAPETESVAPKPVSAIAVSHPVATRPFTKAAWKRNSVAKMEKPVEEPSPGNALRRRIAFVSQASACLSEDHDDAERGGPGVGSLEEAVALARVRLAGPAAPSPASSQSRDVETEEEGCTDTMTAYGDLIEPEDKAGSDSPVSVEYEEARARRRSARVSGRKLSVLCARAMTFEEAVDDCYLTVCECCGFSAETAVLFPVRYVSR